MTIVRTDEVSSIEDVVLRYINHLLERHAMDQHMLANQKPPDERLMAKMATLRAENEALGSKNQGLQGAIDWLHRGMAAEMRDLRAQADECKHANTALLEEMSRLRAQTEPKQGPTTVAFRSIDGDKAISEGREALEKFVETTRQPARGD